MNLDSFKEGHYIGVDEAGRGALAGPVVAAAVCLTPTCDLSFFKDSKTLDESKRLKAFQHLKQETSFIGISIIGIDIIDTQNILTATLISMKEAIFNLPSPPTKTIVIDGNKAPQVKNFNVSTLVKGDALLPAISAASIVAKVTRDLLMIDYHNSKRYCHYGFDKHKGYGTKTHYDKIYEVGVSDIHRKSFNLDQQGRLF